MPCRPLRGQRAWLALVEDWLTITNARADARRNAAALAAVLAGHADWRAGTTRPTWALLGARSGLSRRTVARWLERLRAAGLLVLVQGGTTPRFAPAVLTDPDGGNLAAVYLLTAPTPPARPPRSAERTAMARPEQQPGGRSPTLQHGVADQAVEETGTPSPARSVGEPDTPARAREDTASRPSGRPGEKLTEGNPGVGRRTLDRAWRCQQATTLQDSALALRPLTAAHVAALIRPYLFAGWTVNDLRYALDHHPDGAPHRHTAPVTTPAGWARYRLACWQDRSTGAVLPGRRAQLTAAAHAHRSAQADRRRRRAPEITEAEARAAGRRGLAAVWAALAAAGRARRCAPGVQRPLLEAPEDATSPLLPAGTTTPVTEPR